MQETRRPDNSGTNKHWITTKLGSSKLHTIVEQYVHNGFFFLSSFLSDTSPRERSPWTETESSWVKVIPFRRRGVGDFYAGRLGSCSGIRHRTDSIIDWNACLRWWTPFSLTPLPGSSIRAFSSALSPPENTTNERFLANKFLLSLINHSLYVILYIYIY